VRCTRQVGALAGIQNVDLQQRTDARLIRHRQRKLVDLDRAVANTAEYETSRLVAETPVARVSR
jgi:hypothetical protein